MKSAYSRLFIGISSQCGLLLLAIQIFAFNHEFLAKIGSQVIFYTTIFLVLIITFLTIATIIVESVVLFKE